MQYIKKLVILIGPGARGTLLLKKSGFGVWCELNIFDLQPRKDYKLVIISGDDTHILDIGDGKNHRVQFELGDMGMEEIHAAVISDDVVMYGSNCAKKLSHTAVMERVRSFTKKDESLISYSERDKSKDHINNISSPMYDDFAIAEKNYYPPQVSFEQEAASTLNDDLNAEKTERKEKAKSETVSQNDEVKLIYSEKANHTSAVEKSERIENKKIKEEKRVSKIMPHELEQKFLRLMGSAGAQRGADEAVSGIETAIIDKEQDPPKKASDHGETQKLTVAEKPEVIAMARRITLRDYRVEEPKKASGRKATFFERNSAQIEKLMNSFERFSAMEKMIPGSRFVKINYDKKRYYIVGVIGRDYICYGVPSMYSSVPPEMFDGYARWLPFNADFPHGEGFWMMYQDGISGETLKS